TTLKTMIRANPGLMILKKGTIVDKRNWTDVDQLNFD
ncbi:MAG: DoxX family protein, partial [Flavobacteriaceae bacterium]|nr:DoxX family protein [Flavobacteriaceae bacterium]